MNINAIIVTYNPSIPILHRTCVALLNSGSKVIIVDNSEGTDTAASLNLPEIEIIELKSNYGIAYAQNTGINHAIELGAEVIVFFDQDSEIDSSFLKYLLAPISVGLPMIVAPVFFDAEQGYEFPSFRLNKFGLPKKVYSKKTLEPYAVDIIISSGSAATVEVFAKAGMMDVDLFIDFVDTEWAIRCRKNNIGIMVVPTAIMKHSIGDKSIDFGVMRGFIHSYQRSYYKLRNPFLLLRSRYVPLSLVFKEIISALVHQTVLLFFVDKKAKYLKSYIDAIKDGIKGVKGKYRYN